MNSFSGRPRQMAMEGRTFAQVAAGGAKRARDEGQARNVPAEQDNDANLLSVELTKSPSAFRKQKKRAAKAATAAEAAENPWILPRQEVSSLKTGKSKDKEERASETEEGEEEARRRASALLEVQPTSQQRGSSKQSNPQPQQQQQQQQEQQVFDTDQGEGGTHDDEALAAETRQLKQAALKQVRANKAENAAKPARKATDGNSSYRAPTCRSALVYRNSVLDLPSSKQAFGTAKEKSFTVWNGHDLLWIRRILSNQNAAAAAADRYGRAPCAAHSQGTRFASAVRTAALPGNP